MIRLTVRRILMCALIMGAWLSPTLHAHLLPPQRGTLNFTNDGAFMALSLPLSAFDNLDNDKNGVVSMVEFNQHRADIIRRVELGLVLFENDIAHKLKGIMLSPVAADEHTKDVNAPVVRIYVMGKFIFEDPKSNFGLSVEIFGKKPDEQIFEISSKRKSMGQHQLNKLSPRKSSILLFQETS